MITDWRWRMFLFVRAVDATAANKAAYGAIFANNGSLETAEDEARAFDACTRLSTSGEEPVQAFVVNTAAKPQIRGRLEQFLRGLTDGRYVIVANTGLGNQPDGQFSQTNFPNAHPSPKNRVVTWNDALSFLNEEFGLQVIKDTE